MRSMPHEAYLEARRAACLRRAAASTSVGEIDVWIHQAILYGALAALRCDPDAPQAAAREQSVA